ncbi:hypothetical protein BS47DRAFT_1354318 [Hydnum rufescens UP504]|uniref:Uncharacterized protein n=1 Tax=Hydnum rufescens UP504 TaxID=1448309 RepID=A0A9P6AG18_9AGAM|nr:hypothetical protein BS47DRAFT_1354318 [Hydnum rufescens UP504]
MCFWPRRPGVFDSNIIASPKEGLLDSLSRDSRGSMASPIHFCPPPSLADLPQILHLERSHPLLISSSRSHVLYCAYLVESPW